jgi:hypothetical protein
MPANGKEIPMATAGEYRKHAAECRALARNVKNEQHRIQLLKMADAWENFAVENERAAGPTQTSKLEGERPPHLASE